MTDYEKGRKDAIRDLLHMFEGDKNTKSYMVLVIKRFCEYVLEYPNDEEYYEYLRNKELCTRSN